MELFKHRIALLSIGRKLNAELSDILKGEEKCELHIVESFEELEKLSNEFHFSLIVIHLRINNPQFGSIGVSYRRRESVVVMLKSCCGKLDISKELLQGNVEIFMMNDDDMELFRGRVHRHLRTLDPLVFKKILLQDIEEKHFLKGMIGSSRKIKEVFSSINRVSEKRFPVLILGETGTGKEMVSRAIHNLSKEANRAFIAVNCAAIPQTLIESELFGHEKGAFTGAVRQHIGKFEMADGGTLFLDEIGDMDLVMQAKLLRALETKEFTRVGGKNVIHSDVRILSATNKNLFVEVEKGLFRRDLLYRLNVDSITLPPLRESKEDIPLLVDHFIGKFSVGSSRGKIISAEAMSLLLAYQWPGNIRELKNCIERAGSYCESEAILPEHLPCHIRNAESEEVGLPVLELFQKIVRESSISELPDNFLKRIEASIIPEILEKTQSNRKLTAAKLGLAVNTLRSRLKDSPENLYTAL